MTRDHEGNALKELLDLRRMLRPIQALRPASGNMKGSYSIEPGTTRTRPGLLVQPSFLSAPYGFARLAAAAATSHRRTGAALPLGLLRQRTAVARRPVVSEQARGL